MAEKTTQPIEVKVRTRYEAHHSDPLAGEYLFSYRITITNYSEHRVQLLRRKWYVSDFVAFKRTVEGEGVVGETPVLEAGESYTYSSFCNLISGVGEMKGYYTFFNFSEYREFKVEIPAFALTAPWMLN